MVLFYKLNGRKVFVLMLCHLNNVSDACSHKVLGALGDKGLFWTSVFIKRHEEQSGDL